MAFSVTNNSPSSGYISWTQLHITYLGVTYNIVDGNTNQSFAVWRPSISTTVLQIYSTLPTLAMDDLIVFLNKSGTAVVVPTASIIDGAIIATGSILAPAIAAGTITGDKIAGGTITGDRIQGSTISAEKLTVGTLGTNAVINDSFEEASEANAARAATWVYDFEAAAPAGTYSLNTANRISGAQSLAIAVDTTHQGSVASAAIPVTPGVKWYAQVWAGTNVTTTQGFLFRCYFGTTQNFAFTDAGVLVGDFLSGGATGIGLTSTFNQFASQVTIPNGVQYMRIGVVHKNPNVTATVYVDSFYVVPAIVGAAITPQGITASNILAGTLTTASGVFGSAAITDASIGSLSASKITAGSIGAQVIQLAGATSIIQSSNYVASTTTTAGTGWRIQGDGFAELDQLMVRGGLGAGFLAIGNFWTAGPQNVFRYDTQGLYMGHNTYSSAPFSVDHAGNLIATQATITGAVFATSGTFTGTLTNGTGNNVFKADTSGIYAGNAVFANAPFNVDMTGTLTASRANIIGAATANTIKIGSGANTFGIDVNGLWMGSSAFTGAPFRSDYAGNVVANSINLAGGTISGTFNLIGPTAKLRLGSTTDSGARMSITQNWFRAFSTASTSDSDNYTFEIDRKTGNVTLNGGTINAPTITGASLQTGYDNILDTDTSIFASTIGHWSLSPTGGTAALASGQGIGGRNALALTADGTQLNLSEGTGSWSGGAVNVPGTSYTTLVSVRPSTAVRTIHIVPKYYSSDGSLITPVFTRSSSAYDASAVPYLNDQVRYYSTQYGRSPRIEEPTTNLLTSAQATFEGTYSGGLHPGYTVGTGWTGYTTAQETVTIKQGTSAQSMTLSPTATTSNNFFYFSPTQNILVPGATYTMSGWVWASRAGITWTTRNPQSTLNSSTITSLVVGWNQVSASLVVPPGYAADLHITSFLMALAPGDKIVMDMFQVEQKNYATTWTDTSRAAERLVLSL